MELKLQGGPVAAFALSAGEVRPIEIFQREDISVVHLPERTGRARLLLSLDW
jgi:hypothetical protein